MKRFYILLSVLLTVFLSSCGEEPIRYEIQKTNRGYRGEANRNPYLAAQLFLERYNYDTKESSTARFDVNSYDAVVMPAGSIRTKSQVSSIRRFINSGGHFICLIENGSKDYRDFGFGFWNDDEEIDFTLLEELTLELEIEFIQNESNDYPYSDVTEMREEDKRKYEIPQSELIHVDFGDGQFTAKTGGSWSIMDLTTKERRAPVSRAYYSGAVLSENAFPHSVIKDSQEDGAHRIVSKGYGKHLGRATFITDGRMFRNPHLATQNHATILLGLLEESNSASILFSYGKNEGFYSLLAKNYFYAFVGIILLVFFWLMSRWHRFGPILEPIYAAPISYLRSVESKGHFYWKHKKEQFLIKGLQVRAEKLIGLSYKSSEENEKKLNAVAEELKLDPAHVRKAFRESLDRDPVNFIQDVITLQKTIRHYE